MPVINAQGDYIVNIDKDGDGTVNRFALYRHALAPVELFAVDQSGAVQLHAPLYCADTLVMRNVETTATAAVIFETTAGEVARITSDGRVECEGVVLPPPLASTPASGADGHVHLVDEGAGLYVVLFVGAHAYRLPIHTQV